MAKYNFPSNIKILDTTLRDGEQQPGIILTRKEKVEIAKRLAAIGVHRIEAGTPAASKEDADAIKEIGIGKIVFGSDMDGHDHAWELGRFLSLPLSDEALKPALADNIKKILAKIK